MAKSYKGLDVSSDFGGEFPWKSGRIDVGNGIHQAYVDEGPRDAPLTFVCLHGNPTWSFLYRKFIRALSTSYRVVALDHVGFGRSDKPRDPAYYTIERHIENAATTLRALDVRNAVPIVQDWGGPIGLGWATRHPDLVRGVVILNTWAFVTGEGAFHLPWLFKFLVLGKGGWKRSTQSNIFTEMALIRGGKRKLSKDEQDAYRAAHPTPEDRVGIARFPQLIPEKDATAHESYATLARIEADLAKLADKPALIVWAKKDTAFRDPQLARWKATFHDVTGPFLLENAGHYLQEDAADEILPRISGWAPRVMLSS